MTPCFPRLLAAILGLSLVAIGFSTRSTAQDITVSNPEVLPSHRTPDTPPVFKRAWRVPVPKALKKADRPCYVIIIQYVDESGERLHPKVEGVDLNLVKAFWRDDLAPEFKPARIGRKPVGIYVRITGIFNPESASPKGKDAIPRLLSVAPVVIKKQHIDELLSARKSVRIFADLQIDETGAITGYALAEKSNYAAGFKAEIDTALASWKFAPARAEGKAIASTLGIPLLLVSEESQAPSITTPPVVLRQENPIYPETMRTSGLIGQMQLAFEVNESGHVQNPVVKTSNNPGFDAAAIEAVLQWKFKPGTKDGKPSTTKMVAPIVFNFEDGAGDHAYSIAEPSKKGRTKMLESLGYDTAPKVIDVIEPIYPYELARAGIKGKASVAIVIDKTGRVTSVQLIEASHPEFGLASIAAAERHRFTPAMLNGQFVDSAIKREFEFDTASRKGLSRDDLEMLSLEKKNSPKIVSPSKIDQSPKAISRRPPVFPLGLAPNITTGEATVTFLIDIEGNVRLPRFNTATESAFGYAAVQAIAHWRFEPAMQDGKEVIIRVQVPVAFSAKSAAQN